MSQNLTVFPLCDRMLWHQFNIKYMPSLKRSFNVAIKKYTNLAAMICQDTRYLSHTRE